MFEQDATQMPLVEAGDEFLFNTPAPLTKRRAAQDIPDAQPRFLFAPLSTASPSRLRDRPDIFTFRRKEGSPLPWTGGLEIPHSCLAFTPNVVLRGVITPFQTAMSTPQQKREYGDTPPELFPVAQPAIDGFQFEAPELYQYQVQPGTEIAYLLETWGSVGLVELEPLARARFSVAQLQESGYQKILLPPELLIAAPGRELLTLPAMMRLIEENSRFTTDSLLRDTATAMLQGCDAARVNITAALDKLEAQEGFSYTPMHVSWLQQLERARNDASVQQMIAASTSPTAPAQDLTPLVTELAEQNRLQREANEILRQELLAQRATPAVPVIVEDAMPVTIAEKPLSPQQIAVRKRWADERARKAEAADSAAF